MNEQFRESGSEEILSISLPTDNPELVVKLKNKLKEYEEREVKNNYTEAPIDGYKRAVLGRLLRDGIVDVQGLLQEMGEVHTKGIDMRLFNNAVRVIRNYATGQEDSNRGGTGLK